MADNFASSFCLSLNDHHGSIWQAIKGLSKWYIYAIFFFKDTVYSRCCFLHFTDFQSFFFNELCFYNFNPRFQEVFSLAIIIVHAIKLPLRLLGGKKEVFTFKWLYPKGHQEPFRRKKCVELVTMETFCLPEFSGWCHFGLFSPAGVAASGSECSWISCIIAYNAGCMSGKCV